MRQQEYNTVVIQEDNNDRTIRGLLGTRARKLENKQVRTAVALLQKSLAFVTDLVPSEMACFASSPGRIRRTAVWISRDEIVDFFE